MTNSIKLIEISAEQAINHSRREYNPYEWKKRIVQMQKWFLEVKFYEFDNKVFCIYVSNGINLITELDYISSINNGGLKSYSLKENELSEYGVHISKSRADLAFASALCKLGPVIFASVYFSI